VNIDLTEEQCALIRQNAEMAIRTYNGFIDTARVKDKKERARCWEKIHANNALLEKLEAK